ncbi:hypothetical protein [Kitasatospora camelliae]|uniref:Uncharacterized protein n=1 Tax=Kitasatospora camelliae TaxID=3156397 RepID=A0AAU8K4K8_9ACTN
MTTTLRLHGGPADGVTYRLFAGDPVPAQLELSIRLGFPHGPIDDLPPALLRGEVHAIHHYQHTGDGNYQHQEQP